MFTSSSHEANKNLINAYWTALLREAPRKSVGRFWTGHDISYAVCLSKPCGGLSRSLSLTDGVTTLSNTLSVLLAEKEKHSFLNIDLLTNQNFSGKSERRWRKNIPSIITTSIIFGLCKTIDFSSSFINSLSANVAII